jgi:hypothetical protein
VINLLIGFYLNTVTDAVYGIMHIIVRLSKEEALRLPPRHQTAHAGFLHTAFVWHCPIAGEIVEKDIECLKQNWVN